jgi:hypothetical protein
VMTDQEVETVARAICPLGWHKQNGRMLDWPAYVSMRENSLINARAAIAALDQVRGR